MNTTCEHCGTKITAIRSTKRFCSERCKKAHQRGQLHVPITPIPKPTSIHFTKPKGNSFPTCLHVPIRIPKKCPGKKKTVSDLLEGL